MDYLYGYNGHEELRGLGGHDFLYGGDGDDLLDGGVGNDRLYGQAGNDTYRFGPGAGQDTVYEYDPTAGNVDTLAAASQALDLIFARSGQDLTVDLPGGADRVSVSNWYAGTPYQVEVFRAADGRQLLSTQVDQLIQAMAGFTAANAMSWSQAVQDRPQDVEAILAQHWQAPA